MIHRFITQQSKFFKVYEFQFISFFFYSISIFSKTVQTNIMLHFCYIGINVGLSESYHRFTKLLQHYNFYNVDVQTRKQQKICTIIINGYNLCKSEAHLIAYCLDIRFTKSPLFMPGDSIDSFLNIIKRRMNNDDLYYDVEVQYYEFRRNQSPYDSGL